MSVNHCKQNFVNVCVVRMLANKMQTVNDTKFIQIVNVSVNHARLVFKLFEAVEQCSIAGFEVTGSFTTYRLHSKKIHQTEA